MLTKNLGKALNRQLMEELQSAYIFLNLSAQLEYFHAPGAAKWMRALSVEELDRAAKILDFLTCNGYNVSFDKLEKPSANRISDPEDVFKAALKQENSAADRLKELSELAVAESDFPAFNLLNGFSVGQVATERKLRLIIEKFHTAGSSAKAKRFLDSHFPGP